MAMSRSALAALMLSCFTVSLAFGLLMPLLPEVTRHAGGHALAALEIGRHTGLLTAAYTLALFLAAPAWGRLSDRMGRRAVILIALFGFGVTAIAASLAQSLLVLYAERILSGAFAAGVVPIAAAAVVDSESRDEHRARRLALLSMSGLAGFFVGPVLGPPAAWASERISLAMGQMEPLSAPLLGSALLALLAGFAVARAMRVASPPPRVARESAARPAGNAVPVARLLLLTFVVSGSVAAFEVSLVLRGRQVLGLTPAQLAALFAECSLVMLAMQAYAFSPWYKSDKVRRAVAPALMILAAALFMVPQATRFTHLSVLLALVSGSAGLLSFVLTYWTARCAGKSRGWELGRQTAAASLGATTGSLAGGFLFSTAGVPTVAFSSIALMVTAAAALSLSLPRQLEGDVR